MMRTVWALFIVGLLAPIVGAQDAPTPAEKAALELDAKLIKEAK
jgi:hypothetical protein